MDNWAMNTSTAMYSRIRLSRSCWGWRGEGFFELSVVFCCCFYLSVNDGYVEPCRKYFDLSVFCCFVVVVVVVFRLTLLRKLTAAINLFFFLFLSVTHNTIVGAVKLQFLMASKVSFMFSFQKLHCL